MNAMPTPAILANKKAPAIPPPPAPQIIAKIEPTDPGKIVRPGFQPTVEESVHDGVVKTKQLRRGQRVRPYLHGEPRGSERIVASATKIDNGAYWRVEFASPHPTQEFKAAYRWFDESLVGTTKQTVVQKPAFVHYEES